GDVRQGLARAVAEVPVHGDDLAVGVERAGGAEVDRRGGRFERRAIDGDDRDGGLRDDHLGGGGAGGAALVAQRQRDGVGSGGLGGVGRGELQAGGAVAKVPCPDCD